MKYSCVPGDGVTDLGGVAGEPGTDDCDGLVGATGARCSVEETSSTSDFAAVAIFSAVWLTAGVIGSTGIDVRAGASTLRGFAGGSVGSAGAVAIGGVAGLAGGQLLTPPVCTVLHQGQTTGSVFTGGADGLAATGWTGAALTGGSAGFSGMTGCAGFALSRESAGFGCSC